MSEDVVRGLRTIAPLLWRPQLKNLQAMIAAGILMSTRGKLRQVARATPIAGHRTCLGHFLPHADGDHVGVLRQMSRQALRRMKLSRADGRLSKIGQVQIAFST